jgi:putative transposase
MANRTTGFVRKAGTRIRTIRRLRPPRTRGWFCRGRSGLIGPGSGPMSPWKTECGRESNPKTAGSAKSVEPPLQRRLLTMDFRRKNIRLHPSRYRGRALFFITLCCEARKHVFSESRYALPPFQHLKLLAANYQFNVHAHCIMPDHFHGLVEGTTCERDLLLFVKSLKQTTSLEYSKGTRLHLWQKQFYDHILRATDSPQAVPWYIWMNPVRKGLCIPPTQYLNSGSFAEG